MSISPGLFNNQDYHDTNRIINRRVEEAKNNEGSLEEFQKTIHEYIRGLRPLAEFQDLLRRLWPNLSQQPMASLLPQLSLASNVIGSDRLPTGYRVRFCNGCLDGNMFEPVFASIQNGSSIKRDGWPLLYAKGSSSIRSKAGQGGSNKTSTSGPPLFFNKCCTHR
jgi:hypothetical protein